MKLAQRSLSVVLLLATFPVASQVQPSPDSHLRGDSSGAPDHESAALMGKVVMEDGSDTYPVDAIVVMLCGNDERASANVDRKGQFALVLGRAESALAAPASRGSTANAGDWGDCALRAEASGYRSEPLSLAGEQLSGIVQVGTIILHPVVRASAGEGFAISATSLAAPDKAKKDFQKGQEQARKGKWAAAGDYFRRAVQTYPRYALAWLELGRAQMRQNDFTEAQQSFQQAATQDSNLMPAYVELARVAIEQKQTRSLADATDRILQLSPDSPPVFWFLNAAAHFNMGDVSRAESSVTRGLRLDANHKVPQLEFLYGMVLAKQQNYAAATAHIKTYLQLAPKAADAQQAQQELAAIEKQMSASQNSAR